MQIIITTTDYPHIDRIFQYCNQHNISMYYGQIGSADSDINWQIVDAPSAHLDILLLMFPEWLRVVG
jgi:hypothetical protein